MFDLCKKILQTAVSCYRVTQTGPAEFGVALRRRGRAVSAAAAVVWVLSVLPLQARSVLPLYA